MKKGLSIIIAIIIVGIIIFVGFKLFTNNSNSQNIDRSEYEASKIATENAQNSQMQNQNNMNKTEPIETELYTFSTPIKSNDKNRTTNLKITCSKINGTIIKSGKEFSFHKVVGQPNAKDGYKEADAFGENNEIIKSIGGGNCQVSTTIYNAVLGVNGLKVTERHEHDRPVAYIEDGKDATVAYDYLDLKFENNNNFDIKLYSSVKDDKVVVRIVKIVNSKKTGNFSRHLPFGLHLSFAC